MAVYNHHIYGPRDVQVGLVDRKDGRYCLSIGGFDGITVIGDLSELAQIFTMGESLVEHEQIRKAMPEEVRPEEKEAV